MRILSIDTSCDETSAAVTEGTKVLSNVIWSQASLHAKWGGILPSLAQREHRERISWVVNRAIRDSRFVIQDLDAIAVTVGPCLAIAGEVGITKAKELAKKYNIPIIPVNHVEGHFLSALAERNLKLKTQSSKNNSEFKIQNLEFPCLGLVVSGGNTQVILAEKLGKYHVLATTSDDALGEVLDKGARLLGLGYPGGAILEKFARQGKVNSYPLPIPMLGREKLHKFSYSGLKTALVRLVEKIKKEKGLLSKSDIQNLAAVYQDKAFTHLIRVLSSIVQESLSAQTGKFQIHNILIGGGVSANIELRKRLRKLGKKYSIKITLPYSKKLCTDNAAMIGVAGFYAFKRGVYLKGEKIEKIDRRPRLPISEKLF